MAIPHALAQSRRTRERSTVAAGNIFCGKMNR